MKNYRKHIDDFFREKLGSYAETPPSEVWENLETRLDTLVPNGPTAPRLPGSSAYRWLWHFGMLSLTVVVGVVLTKMLPGALSATKKTSIEAAAVKPIEAVPVAASTVKNVDDNKETTNAGKSVKQNVTPATTNNIIPNQPANKQAAVTTGKMHIYGSQAQAGNKQSTPTANDKNLSAGAEQEAIATVNSNIYSAWMKPVVPIKTALVRSRAIGKPLPELPGKYKPYFKWEAGIKGGYEMGFTNLAATKYTVSPYIQFNITRKLSIMTQPAVKYAKIASRNIASQTYYQANGWNPTALHVDSSYKNDNAINPYWLYSTTVTYTQTHDSIIKSYSVGGTYLEFEMPLLLKYAITSQFSIYGGANMVFTKLPGITEHTDSQRILSTSGPVTRTQVGSAPTPPPPPGDVAYPGTPLSSYKGPLSPAQQGGQLTFGYTIGFSYEYSKRWLFDALMQQNPTKSDVKGNYNLNIPLSSPYFRLSVGYKLIK